MKIDAPLIDRQNAGIRLAQALSGRLHPPARIVALLRGGAPVAREIAFRLRLPWEVLIVRKVGAPGNPEFGIGAVAEGKVSWLDPSEISAEHWDHAQIARSLHLAERERDERIHRFRRAGFLEGRPDSLAGENVWIVDDGLATGNTVLAAVESLRRRGAKSISLAVPVASQEGLAKVAPFLEQIVCLLTPQYFGAVGNWYETFETVAESDLYRLLSEVEIPLRPGLMLKGRWGTGHGESPHGLAVFVHGAGSGKASPRNLRLAQDLEAQGIHTLVFDLLSEAESRASADGMLPIAELAERVLRVSQWALARLPDSETVPLAWVGSSSGAAVALWAAADPRSPALTVVSRGGRIDLALPKLRQVRCPVLLLVGTRDTETLRLSQELRPRIPNCHLIEVRGAGHLFEEPGTLQIASEELSRWIKDHFDRSLKLAA